MIFIISGIVILVCVVLWQVMEIYTLRHKVTHIESELDSTRKQIGIK